VPNTGIPQVPLPPPAAVAVTGEHEGVATLGPLRVIRPIFVSARDRDTSCHGKTVAALVQRRLRTPMRHYEIMIILDPNLEERTVQPSLDQFLKVVTGGGGKVDKVDIWGKRRLAYQIEKKSEGIYAVVDLSAEPAVVQELDRQLNLNEAVLRTKVMRPEHRH
jgi:small subunit ribosomal protein S6